MKHNILLIFLLISAFSFAQSEETEKVLKKYERQSTELHEISFNAPLLILGNAQVSYENLLSQQFTFGATVSIPFDDYVSWRLNYGVTAFGRYYFGEEYARGYYFEGFMNFNNHRVRFDEQVEFVTFRRTTNVSNLALGFSFGKKLVSSNNFTLDIFGGIGRNLFEVSSRYDRQFRFIPRVGVYVGYRF